MERDVARVRDRERVADRVARIDPAGRADDVIVERRNLVHVDGHDLRHRHGLVVGAPVVDGDD